MFESCVFQMLDVAGCPPLKVMCWFPQGPSTSKWSISIHMRKLPEVPNEGRSVGRCFI